MLKFAAGDLLENMPFTKVNLNRCLCSCRRVFGDSGLRQSLSIFIGSPAGALVTLGMLSRVDLALVGRGRAVAGIRLLTRVSRAVMAFAFLGAAAVL